MAAEEGKTGSKSEEPGTPGEAGAGAGAAHVSFLTAALMGVALCFHSILEVRTAHPQCMPCLPAVSGHLPLGSVSE